MKRETPSPGTQLNPHLIASDVEEDAFGASYLVASGKEGQAETGTALMNLQERGDPGHDRQRENRREGSQSREQPELGRPGGQERHEREARLGLDRHEEQADQNSQRGRT